MIESVEQAPFNVLFLDAGNSARSIIAEAILNREGRGRFRASSAGILPKGTVHPYALDLLSKLNFDVSGCRSKSWSEFLSPGGERFDFIFSVGDEIAPDACPAWPGQPMTAHWPLPDPSAMRGNEAEIRLAFAETYRMLNNRIVIFSSLPIPALDQIALRRQIDLLARTQDACKQDARKAAPVAA